MNQQQQHIIENFEKFVLAGKAIFTVENVDTHRRFTYKIKKFEKNPNFNMWFVSVLRGQDNITDYMYIGMLKDNKFKLTNGSKVDVNTSSFKVFNWLWNNFKVLPSNIKIWHEGRCGRCGRKLTVPTSIANGFGPECINLV